MANVDPRVKRLIIQRARKYGVDPAAALAVAMGEGGLRNRKNDRGDGGRSFGPFQEYEEGALPRHLVGKPEAADRWAWSAAGIDHAIRLMAESGAAGLKGEAAVNAIVRKFERPADPDTSVANAIKRLGTTKIAKTGPSLKVPVSGAGSTLAYGGAGGPELPVPAQALGTLNDIFRKVGLEPLDIVGDLPLPRKQPSPSVPGRAVTPPSTAAAPAQTPALKLPRVKRMVNLIGYAQKLGLRVSENPFVDGVEPVHVSGSHHYQVVGKHKGKKVGRAIDVAGDPEALKQFWAYAETFAGNGLDDLFWDAAGYSYDRGKRWDRVLGDHGDHLHLSIR